MPLKLINQVQDLSITKNGFAMSVNAKLRIPGFPVLAVFCCDAIHTPLREKRTGTYMQHGKKIWYPCNPGIYEPTSVDGTNYSWQFPTCQCGIGRKATFVLTEFGAPPILNWSSLPHESETCSASSLQVEIGNLFNFVGIENRMANGFVSNGDIEFATSGWLFFNFGYWQLFFDGEIRPSPGTRSGQGQINLRTSNGTLVASSGMVPYTEGQGPVSVNLHATGQYNDPFNNGGFATWERANDAIAVAGGTLTIQYMA